MAGVADRLLGRVQITTDGLGSYKNAVFNVFRNDVDHAILVKEYANGSPGNGRYSPSVVTGIKKTINCGNPDIDTISTSYVERSNLTMRMSMRRYTRLTNGHSKKFANHCHMTAVFFVYYNFARRHQTIKTTPAVAAQLADHVWTIEEIVGLISSEV